MDVIATPTTQAAAAVRSNTTTIPIVLIGVADPVGSGLITSLALARRQHHRPGKPD